MTSGDVGRSSDPVILVILVYSSLENLFEGLPPSQIKVYSRVLTFSLP